MHTHRKKDIMSAFTINTHTEGNLVADPVTRQTSTGKSVTNARIAVTTRSIRDGEKHERTEFVNLVIWNQMGTNLAATCSKGDRVCVSGDLRNRSFEGKDGQTKYVSEIVADSVSLSLRYHVAAGIHKASEVLADA